jgi:hypothetical protein
MVCICIFMYSSFVKNHSTWSRLTTHYFTIVLLHGWWANPAIGGGEAVGETERGGAQGEGGEADGANDSQGGTETVRPTLTDE